MKKILLAVVMSAVIGNAYAQSIFEGLYGQIATGYESNNISNTDLQVNQSRIPGVARARTLNDVDGGSSSKSGMPLVIGVGYTFSLESNYTIGFGFDYSALNTTTSTIQYSTAGLPNRANKAYYEVSNRYSIFLSPGIAIDKDKLAYLKAGYTNQKLAIYDGTSGNFEGSTQMGGYIAGLGYKQMIASGLYLYGEANYYFYPNSGLNGTGATTGARAGGTFSQTSNPSANAYNFLVGVGYKF